MSSSQKSIRVVKRRQRDYLAAQQLAAQQETPESQLKTESQTRREIFNTVTSWIEEQRETKKELQRCDGLRLGNV
jgi:predicted ATPase